MDEYGTVTLTLDDGELECLILTTFMADGREYIALLPLDENDEPMDVEPYIYRYIEVDGEPGLDNIEDDEEYEIAYDALDEWYDTQEWEELNS